MTGARRGRVHIHRGRYLLHLAAHLVVSGVIAYGESTEGVPAGGADAWGAPVWWRRDARRDLAGVEEFCTALEIEQWLPGVEPPPSRE